MLGTSKALPDSHGGRWHFSEQACGPETPAREKGSVTGQGNRVRKNGRLARSDERSTGFGLFGSESGHALQVRRRREDSRVQAGQPLALQKVEAGPVDGREVEPAGAGSETEG